MNQTVKELRKKQQQKELLHSWGFYDAKITPLELDMNSINLLLEHIRDATVEDNSDLLEAALSEIHDYTHAIQLLMDDIVENVKEMREFNEKHRETEVSLR